MIEFIKPIYDRTQQDIDNKTPKAFMNVLDWERITNNILYVQQLFVDYNGTQVELLPMITVAMQSIPTERDINALGQNVERLAQSADSIRISLVFNYDWGYTDIHGDFIGGLYGTTPDYVNFNIIEKNIAILRGQLWGLLQSMPRFGLECYAGENMFCNGGLI